MEATKRHGEATPEGHTAGGDGSGGGGDDDSGDGSDSGDNGDGDGDGSVGDGDGDGDAGEGHGERRGHVDNLRRKTDKLSLEDYLSVLGFI